MGGSIGLPAGDLCLLRSAASGLGDFRRRPPSSSLTLRGLLDGAIGDPAIWVIEESIDNSSASTLRSAKLPIVEELARRGRAEPLTLCEQTTKQKTNETTLPRVTNEALATPHQP